MTLPVSSFLLFQLSFLLLTIASFSQQPLCQDHESSALVHLRNSFLISRHASDTSSGYPKTLSWKRHKDCCWWDGVECDAETGYVIGLDLSSSHLHGSISSNSSLFHLVHLRKLNLADNDFNYSQIPSEIGQLKALSYLNLSHSTLSGPVPHGISELSKLVSLDLSDNDYNGQPLLKLDKHNLQRLVENLTSLEELHLSFVYVPFPLPLLLANLSSLNSLILDNCWLQGTFPQEIFLQPKLQVLNVESNSNLTGQIPEFLSGSPLKELKLASTGFFGSLPASLGNLASLTIIRVEESEFGGRLPSSLGNLTKLNFLDLADNNFIGPMPSSLGNLTQLVYLSLDSIYNLSHGSYAWLNGHPKLAWLYLGGTNLFGGFPFALRNLTQLTTLELSSNQLSGPIPSWLSNLTRLSIMNLGGNQLDGPITGSVSKLYNLEVLFLQENNFGGTLELNIFSNLTNLKVLDVGFNKLSLLTNTNATWKLVHLGMGACNIKEFPRFIQNQDALESLDLSSNNIHGTVPEWMWKASRKIQSLHLESNFLTGSINSSLLQQLSNLHALDLSNNTLQGTLPIPPPSLLVYSVSVNALSGVISHLFCNLHSLIMLEVSGNNLSGSLPQCLGSSSNNIQVLDLQNNFFQGRIPWIFAPGNRLRMLALGSNQLRGPIPRSLANCLMLEKLDLSNNQISDIFPSWLGGLSQLQVLGLRSNKLYGRIGKLDFPALRIVDLSYNKLVGELPTGYFETLSGMKAVQQDSLSYMSIDVAIQYTEARFLETLTFIYFIDLGIKGRYVINLEILKTMIAIDLSNNKFEGQIPKSLGGLLALILLNLSNNHLSGVIPESIGNLTNLEAMDLSHNTLSGQIPQQLTVLNFLELFDVSDNHLVGPIPQGMQFNTFPNSSFQGNPGLCGPPLSKPCFYQTGSTSDEDKDENEDFVIKWVIISLGFGSGLVVGVILGNIFVQRYDVRLAWNIFGWRTLKRPRRKVNKPTGINRRKSLRSRAGKSVQALELDQGSLQVELGSVQLQPGLGAKEDEMPDSLLYQGAFDENAKRREIARGKLPSIQGS